MSRVLVVGAGGIGCEVLKDLVMSGILDISVIDLDTIDLSNLNRQFLFQSHHIGQSKAIVAAQAVMQFNPAATVVPYFQNVFDDIFDVAWFEGFDVVLNALDNLKARRYVNRMCLAAGVPLVESGTAGYLGQVTVHKKDELSCFECTAQEKEKRTYPVCTIRSTPTEPVHCIVWSKDYLFNQLFGKEEDTIEEDTTIEKKEDITQKEVLIDMTGKELFEKVFYKDVMKLLDMHDLWLARTKPIPLVLKELIGAKAMDHKTLAFDQKCWTMKQNTSIFLSSLAILTKRLREMREEDETATLSFDKDDEASLNFVTATANLRSTVYSISVLSRFKIKEIAGNIIPAIATTNAIVAGMVVMAGLRILKEGVAKCKSTFLAYGGDRKHYLMNEKPPKPNPKCMVCSVTYLQLSMRQSATLGSLVEYLMDLETKPILLGELTVQVGERLLYDIEFEDNLGASLEELEVKDGAQITVTNDNDDDESKNYTVVMFLKCADKDGVTLKGDLEGLKTRPIVERVEEEIVTKREAEEPLERSAKRTKVDVEDDVFAPISID